MADELAADYQQKQLYKKDRNCPKKEGKKPERPSVLRGR